MSNYLQLASLPTQVRCAWCGILVLSVGMAGCRRNVAPPVTPLSEHHESGLVRVGTLTITREDLDFLITEKYAGSPEDSVREKAMAELVSRARFAQAALDAGMLHDPIVRSELARLLGARLREQKLAPAIRASREAIPESRLRECYTEAGARFAAPERRQVAVLWLNPGKDPLRKEQYVGKLNTARTWFLNESDLGEQPSRGFGVLSIDHSEHQASRFKHGIVGWVEREGASDPWRQAVANIAFSLGAVGAVSDVVARPEGVFLVRLMEIKPDVVVPFEDVAGQLAEEERFRRRHALEIQFEKDISARYAAELLTPDATDSTSEADRALLRLKGSRRTAIPSPPVRAGI